MRKAQTVAETRLRFSSDTIPNEVRSRGPKAVAKWVREEHERQTPRRISSTIRSGAGNRLTELFRQLGPRPPMTRPHDRADWDVKRQTLWPEIRREAARQVLESYRAIDDVYWQIEELRRSRTS